MKKEITVIGELHQDLYYESNFHEILIERLTSEILKFLKYNPDDVNSQILRRVITRAIEKIAKKLEGASYLKRGGNGNNSSEIIASLGIPTKLISVIGRRSRWMIEELQKLGINTEHIYEIDELTPVSTIIKSNITTKIHIAPNLKQKMNFENKEIDLNTFNQTKIVFSTPFSKKFARLFNEISNLDLISAFTVELQAINSLNFLANLISSKKDILFINIDDALQIINESKTLSESTSIQEVDKFFIEFARIRVYTAGSKGSYVFTDDFHLNFPIFESNGIIDLTGAGDAFAAGFLSCMYYLINNKAFLLKNFETQREKLSKILEECMRYATYSSLFKITKQYAPTREEFEEFIKGFNK